jgi:hypothetical protein
VQLAKNVFTIEEFFKNEIAKGKIHAEQFSEEEKLLKFTDIATKVIEYHGSDFAMLNVPKTVRLLFTIRVVVEWQVLLI